MYSNHCQSSVQKSVIYLFILLSLLFCVTGTIHAQECTADFKADNTTICKGDQVTFTDLSQNAQSWVWYFTNGSPSIWQGQTPPLITYNQTGYHDVKLEIWCPESGTVTKVKTKFIHVQTCPCDAGFTVDKTSGTVPLTVTFTDQSQNALSWYWTFEGGNLLHKQTRGPHQITYNQAGDYDVTLQIYCPNGSDIYQVNDLIHAEAAIPLYEYGDAPEEALAYPSSGQIGHFPTCKNVGPNGYVKHGSLGTMYWGHDIDYELDGNGGSCSFSGNYDNDEGLISAVSGVSYIDAGLKRPHNYTILGDPGEEHIHRPSILDPRGYLGVPGTSIEWGNSGATRTLDIWYNVGDTDAYVNILIDWNQDGEWGGSYSISGVGVAHEHAVQNFLIPAGSGSDYLSELSPPSFIISPTQGYVWTRFTISESEVAEDWNGEGIFDDGETEDYLICVSKVGFFDYGDAPEGGLAYPSTGQTGYFPTCEDYTLRGYIKHETGEYGTTCNFGKIVDYEQDGNANFCPYFVTLYDKDEGYYNPSGTEELSDPGLRNIVPYTILGGMGYRHVEALTSDPALNESMGGTCQLAQWGPNLDMYLEVSSLLRGSYVNVLVDWNQDGEWGGTTHCSCSDTDVEEHILQNFYIPDYHSGLLSELSPPLFRIGSQSGYVWARMTISKWAVGVPWTGDAIFEDGETEDYLLHVSNYFMFFDYGDASSHYGTFHKNCGAIHTIQSGFCLGDTVDADPDGLPGSDGEGDDKDGADDEDGVKFLSEFTPGQTAEIEVTANVSGILNAWIDFDRDGSWDGESDHIATDYQMGARIDTLVILVPEIAAPGTTFARFRFSDTGGLSFDGPCYFGNPENDQTELPPIGEVEDYAIPIGMGSDTLYDYGDALDPPYPTLNTSFGAYHAIDSTIYMGELIDDELDGQPHISAVGDNINNLQDEDGVQLFNTWAPGDTAHMKIVLFGNGYLNLWADLNDDGDWDDPYEHMLNDTVMSPGTHFLHLLIPDTIRFDSTYARFRFSTLPNLTYQGFAPDGEVEDHLVIGTVKYDFGDALDPPYPTLFTSSGAYHVIDSTIIMGTRIDDELDGQPDLSSLGDNIHNLQDEDGVQCINTWNPGDTAHMNITLFGNGYLNLWADLNDDGDWADANEHMLRDTILIPGTHMVHLPIPESARFDSTYARFRFSTMPNLTYEGFAPDGEVEDYIILSKTKFDFGDAPDPTYPTLYENSGAYHVIDSSTYMGALFDDELDGQPHISALGDNINNLQDEDGVHFHNTWDPGDTAHFEITLHGDGYLNLWADLNYDGDWDDSYEHMLNDTVLIPGTHTLHVPIPETASYDSTYIRFRFSSTPNLTCRGFAPDGEVEDHVVLRSMTDVNHKEKNLKTPNTYRLLQNYPNPFNPLTQIRYELSRSAHVKLTLFNISGQQIRVLVDKTMDAGNHVVQWDGLDEQGRHMPTGTYFYHIKTEEFEDTKKLILLK
jgi:PKD repeat protein